MKQVLKMSAISTALLALPMMANADRVFPPVSGRKFPHGEIFYRKNAPKAQGRT